MAKEVARADRIALSIRTIRGQRVLLDSDLAALYGVGTKALNQAVKRNAARFPADFAFRLTAQEYANLISQTVISSSGHGGRRRIPRVFTVQGPGGGSCPVHSLIPSDREQSQICPGRPESVP